MAALRSQAWVHGVTYRQNKLTQQHIVVCVRMNLPYVRLCIWQLNSSYQSMMENWYILIHRHRVRAFYYIAACTTTQIKHILRKIFVSTLIYINGTNKIAFAFIKMHIQMHNITARHLKPKYWWLHHITQIANENLPAISFLKHTIILQLCVCAEIPCFC